jgi:hypothetical protein
MEVNKTRTGSLQTWVGVLFLLLQLPKATASSGKRLVLLGRDTAPFIMEDVDIFIKPTFTRPHANCIVSSHCMFKATLKVGNIMIPLLK